jgi:hypothetical protein
MKLSIVKQFSFLPITRGDNNHSYVGMMLENMKKMIIALNGNLDALKDINPQYILTR